MGFRFFKRIKLLPGVYINISKSGPSLSLGPRGIKTTIGRRGIRQSLGLPGTGMSYSKTFKPWGGKSSQTNKRPARSYKPTPCNEAPAEKNDYEKLNLGFFAKLLCSKEEKALAKGIQACILGDYAAAEPHLKAALPLPDAAFTLATAYLNTQRFAEAEKLFALAEQTPEEIGRIYQKYSLGMTIHLAVCPFYEADFPPCVLVSYLAHVEMLQELRRIPDACKLLQTAQARFPDNLDVIISLAEILLENEAGNAERMQEILDMTQGLENDSYAHAVLLMYRAEAFDNLGMTEEAISTLTSTMRKKADRPKEFLLELQFQRGNLYEKAGKHAQALKDLNAVTAEEPSYADVANMRKQVEK